MTTLPFLNVVIAFQIREMQALIQTRKTKVHLATQTPTKTRTASKIDLNVQRVTRVPSSN